MAACAALRAFSHDRRAVAVPSPLVSITLGRRRVRIGDGRGGGQGFWLPTLSLCASGLAAVEWNDCPKRDCCEDQLGHCGTLQQ